MSAWNRTCNLLNQSSNCPQQTGYLEIYLYVRAVGLRQLHVSDPYTYFIYFFLLNALVWIQITVILLFPSKIDNFNFSYSLWNNN